MQARLRQSIMFREVNATPPGLTKGEEERQNDCELVRLRPSGQGCAKAIRTTS